MEVTWSHGLGGVNGVWCGMPLPSLGQHPHPGGDCFQGHDIDYPSRECLLISLKL